MPTVLYEKCLNNCEQYQIGFVFPCFPSARRACYKIIYIPIKYTAHTHACAFFFLLSSNSVPETDKVDWCRFQLLYIRQTIAAPKVEVDPMFDLFPQLSFSGASLWTVTLTDCSVD